ncbi:GTP 3',8-cyclase MoaA [Bacteroidota bacterium]
MLDKFNRKIDYLRISVTDRCNLRCTYCMPEGGVESLNHKDILSYDEIVNIVKLAVKNGINKIRLTGGEPLVRKGICNLVQMISSVPGIEDLSLTTNGMLLDEYAEDLKKAGLNRVNISLDSVYPEKFRKITRGGDINLVFKGIKAAEKAGLLPVKINCVVLNSSLEKDAKEVAKYCKLNSLELRYIHQMDLQTGKFSIVEGGSGGDCKKCNRLRLTSNGYIKPCLFSDLGYNIREIGAEKAFNAAIQNKPECGSYSQSEKFYSIGG